jgi:diguanylate cyclase (GGDEF)-like protein
MLIGSYVPSLVLVSVLVAVLASYTSLDLAGRVASAKGRAAAMWGCGGALSMGIGIWSTHFIGMLAFDLPIELAFDLPITSLSLLIAILSSGLALWLVSQPRLLPMQLAFGALLTGAGISAMHYTGMASLRMHPAINYHMPTVLVSLVIAVAAAAISLWIAFRLREQTPYVALARGASAAVMGLAIVGMHYSGMAAARFDDGSFCGALASGIGKRGLDSLVTVTSLAVSSITLLASILDSRLEARTAELSRSLTEANRELTHLALHDTLTGLPNRVMLAERIGNAMRQVDNQGGSFALMFMDLDGFKTVNDAFGHHLGDQLLHEVGLRLRSNLHHCDTLARIGGDEFVLLVEIEADSAVAAIAARQVQVIAEPFQIAGQIVQISASIGISLYPGHGHTQEELLMNADAAMYHAKGLGKNGFSIFDCSMNTDARNQLELLHDLRVALKCNHFCLFYQPKFDAISGQPVGAEALLRWNHPQKGLLLPDKFIGLAERTGLIVAIGEWVLDEACRQMRIWSDMGYGHWRIAVNLSTIQFCHPTLLDTVARTLQQHRLPANNLTLEITETTAMNDADGSLAVLRQLAAMGVDLSIDDFGTGYSSLMYLKRLPANEIKIDRGFVRDLEHDSNDAAIISAIVAVGQALNLRIVAEGIENDRQQHFLTRLGCDSLQGFLLGLPLPPDRFMADIRAARAKTALDV